MHKKQIFKQGSRTYYYSSFFFSDETFKEVSTLYAFVRVADDYVDSIPQQKEEFQHFVQQFHTAWSGTKVDNHVIDDFVDLAKMLEFDLDWIEAFLASMEMDLHKKEYATMDELLEYIHGSAEVIGLMMAKIMRLPEESYKTAGMLGRSMQYINFLRDIQEDLELGRTYIPLSERSRFGFTEITEAKAKERKEDFIKFFQAQIEQYEEWDNYARKGFSFLPKRFRIPIKTAADMYRWTAKQLKKNPFLVFERKVKPGKRRILFTGVRNFFS